MSKKIFLQPRRGETIVEIFEINGYNPEGVKLLSQLESVNNAAHSGFLIKKEWYLLQ